MLSGTTERHAPPKEAFPRVGKVARQRRMRAKQASVPHNASHHPQRHASIPRPCPPPCHPERSGTTHQYSSAPTNHRRTANPAPPKEAFLFEGEGGAKRRMRAKQANVVHNATPLCVRVPGWRNALHDTFKQRRSSLLAPRLGDGVRCAALFGCVARPYTRCAASLRMTRG